MLEDTSEDSMLLFDTEFRRKDGTDDFACNILKYRGD